MHLQLNNAMRLMGFKWVSNGTFTQKGKFCHHLLPHVVSNPYD